MCIECLYCALAHLGEVEDLIDNYTESFSTVKEDIAHIKEVISEEISDQEEKINKTDKFRYD